MQKYYIHYLKALELLEEVTMDMRKNGKTAESDEDMCNIIGAGRLIGAELLAAGFPYAEKNDVLYIETDGIRYGIEKKVFNKLMQKRKNTDGKASDEQAAEGSRTPTQEETLAAENKQRTADASREEEMQESGPAKDAQPLFANTDPVAPALENYYEEEDDEYEGQDVEDIEDTYEEDDFDGDDVPASAFESNMSNPDSAEESAFNALYNMSGTSTERAGQPAFNAAQDAAEDTSDGQQGTAAGTEDGDAEDVSDTQELHLRDFMFHYEDIELNKEGFSEKEDAVLYAAPITTKEGSMDIIAWLMIDGEPPKSELQSTSERRKTLSFTVGGYVLLVSGMIKDGEFICNVNLSAEDASKGITIERNSVPCNGKKGHLVLQDDDDKDKRIHVWPLSEENGGDGNVDFLCMIEDGAFTQLDESIGSRPVYFKDGDQLCRIMARWDDEGILRCMVGQDS